MKTTTTSVRLSTRMTRKEEPMSLCEGQKTLLYFGRSEHMLRSQIGWNHHCHTKGVVNEIIGGRFSAKLLSSSLWSPLVGGVVSKEVYKMTLGPEAWPVVASGLLLTSGSQAGEKTVHSVRRVGRQKLTSQYGEMLVPFASRGTTLFGCYSMIPCCFETVFTSIHDFQRHKRCRRCPW